MAGYNLHIERDGGISLQEWLDVCEHDDSLTVQHTFEIENPRTGDIIEISSPNSCVWTRSDLDEEFTFRFFEGSISFGYSQEQLEKAKEIAQMLKAKVVGEEGESY